MNLKSILKSLKLNESTVSMVLGAIVIIVVGMLIVNYFKNIDSNGMLPPVEITDELTLPASHIVADGEDLWKISEIYYGNGYNWVDIANENNLESAGLIEVGQELIIPDVSLRVAETITTEDEIELVETPSPTPTEAVVVMEEEDVATEQEVVEPQTVTGQTYTVVKGDTLWAIAERAYGNGYRWVDIARANDLVNPNVIHTGNVFTLPR